MTELERLARTLYELMGLDQIGERILNQIEDDVVNSYFPVEMEGEDMSVRYYGAVIYGGLDLIKDGKIEYSPISTLDSKHLDWMLKFSDDGNLRISYMREDVPLQTWTLDISFPEWPNKNEGEWIYGELVIEKNMHRPQDSSIALEMHGEVESERLKKIVTMYSLL